MNLVKITFSLSDDTLLFEEKSNFCTPREYLFLIFDFDFTSPANHKERILDSYQLPLCSFILQNSKNVICAGRMIDADAEAFAASRVMVNLNQVGEAGGTASL